MVSDNSDVVIKIGGDVENLKLALAKARKALKRGDLRTTAESVAKKAFNLSGMQKDLRNIMKGGLGLPPDALQGFTDANTHLNKLRKGAVKSVDGFQMMSKGVKGAISDVSANIKKSKIEFQGWAMSIMFFGMALKRIFSEIWKSGKTTFQDIMHSTEGTVTGFDHLNASVKYLGYTIGSAFEPIAAWLAPIVWAIAEWVMNNQTLAATLLIIVGVFGLLFQVIGSMTLAIMNGFIPMFQLLAPIISGAFTGLVTFFAGLTAPIWGLIGIIAAVLAIFVVMWMTNFGGIRDFFKATWDIILAVFGSVWKNIKAIFKNFIEFFKNVFNGDIDKAFDNLGNIIEEALAIIIKLFIGLGAIIVNILIFAVNLGIDTFFILFRFINWMIKAIVTSFIWMGKQIALSFVTPIQFMINQINRVIRALHKAGFAKGIKTINVDLIGGVENVASSLTEGTRSFFDGIADGLKSVQEEWKLGYISGDFVKTAVSNVDNALGTGGTVVNNITINQQPGQDGMDVADAIIREQEMRTN
jgi:hypothetical protein